MKEGGVLSPAKTAILATPLTLFSTAAFEEVLVGFAMELNTDALAQFRPKKAHIRPVPTSTACWETILFIRKYCFTVTWNIAARTNYA